MEKSRVAVVFGTRPECIKLAPVIRAIDQHSDMESLVVSSSQHTDLLRPFLRSFSVEVDHDLGVMRPGQSPNGVLSRVLSSLEPLFQEKEPDVVLVQGDTTTALSGALTAFHNAILVGHVEAGLRTGDVRAPFPEEMNRRLISRVADLHFAATRENVSNLRQEGVPDSRIWQTGNPVVDALEWILANRSPSQGVHRLLQELSDQRIIVLTTHRRESFGKAMRDNLQILADFVTSNRGYTVVFPVHPNPNVRAVAEQVLTGTEGVRMIDPLDYPDFIHLLSQCWLIVSDSGGVQEEAPSLGKRLIVLRRSTERPEVVDAGIARLVGDDPPLLRRTLESAIDDEQWTEVAGRKLGLYGSGDAAARIVEVLAERLS
jgi:UDP-N-acetylglucosamine 2-epimerase (non-hydrolysing)